jgi:ribosomal protein L37AE/L43A
VTPWNLNERRCPRCRSTDVARSERRGILELILLRYTDIRPYRCKRCEQRHYSRIHLGAQPRKDSYPPATGEQA